MMYRCPNASEAFRYNVYLKFDNGLDGDLHSFWHWLPLRLGVFLYFLSIAFSFLRLALKFSNSCTWYPCKTFHRSETCVPHGPSHVFSCSGFRSKGAFTWTCSVTIIRLSRGRWVCRTELLKPRWLFVLWPSQSFRALSVAAGSFAMLSPPLPLPLIKNQRVSQSPGPSEQLFLLPTPFFHQILGETCIFCPASGLHVMPSIAKGMMLLFAWTRVTPQLKSWVNIQGMT